MRTYSGKYDPFADDKYTITQQTDNIWENPYTNAYRHHQGSTPGDNRNGCFVQRIKDDSRSGIEIEEGLPYEVIAGYDVYDTNYDMNADRAT